MLQIDRAVIEKCAPNERTPDVVEFFNNFEYEEEMGEHVIDLVMGFVSKEDKTEEEQADEWRINIAMKLFSNFQRDVVLVNMLPDQTELLYRMADAFEKMANLTSEEVAKL